MVIVNPHDESDEQTEVIRAYVETFGIQPDQFDAAEFLDSYSGCWESEREFAEQLADDLGLIDSDLSWPHTCIDWDQATRELMYDYSSARASEGRVYIFRCL